MSTRSQVTLGAVRERVVQIEMTGRVTHVSLALAQYGLGRGRVIYAEVGDKKSALVCFEEGLHHGAMTGVVNEVAKLAMTASRRLQLVAEK